MNWIPELLAPAGNMERLKTALHFGADAVYLGLQAMSLRNLADNFTEETLKEACDYAHERGKKVYVTCNAFLKDDKTKEADDVILAVKKAGADALIVNDPGVIVRAKQLAPSVPLHLSTQANTLNSHAARFWQEQGISRIVLARELTLAQAKAIKNNVPELEIEIFVHGAMCVSYSGRCLLSNYLTGRDSNGECVQPCRWSYEMREKGKDGEYFNIEQDELGTYILNSKDMNMLPVLKDVVKSGAASLKIEGRMKSVYYVATVTNAYRMALDAIKEGRDVPKEAFIELEKCSHRPYSTGFSHDSSSESMQAVVSGGYIHGYDLVAIVTDITDGRITLQQRNRFFEGDTLEILSPNDVSRSLVVNDLRNDLGEPIEFAPHPKQVVTVQSSVKVRKGDILRKRLS